MKRVEAFFREIDANWPGARTDEVRLQIIGSSALLLQTDYDRGTKDGDVLETDALHTEMATRLLGIAGRGTPIHKRHRMYVEIVPRGIPFLAVEPNWNRLSALNRSLTNLEIEVLDVVNLHRIERDMYGVAETDIDLPSWVTDD